MPNTKKTQFSTWLSDTAAFRATLSQIDPNENALYRFLRSVEKEAARVQSDRDRG